MKGIYDLCHRHPSFFSKIKGETDMSLEREKVDLYILKKTSLQTPPPSFLFL
jgi:hypothetical protein